MYKGLSRAQLSFDYLHTNSTTHEFLFGALAELLDNARDAYATKINIYSVEDARLRGGYMLCFVDDGQGMSPVEAGDIITFGKSTKKTLDSHMIGKYGNGLKSGSMRIGNDLILFTKKENVFTCVFLSRTFHENEKLEEIIVPMPSFETSSKRPLTKTPRDKEKHLTEMQLILKYSPFKTEAQFFKEFDKIEGPSGTLVIIYNMKLLDSGGAELDVKSDAHDVLLAVVDGESIEDGLMPEKRSFRSYASILYVDPRMRVYIQGRKVRTKRIVSSLYKPRLYKFTSSRFKARSEKEAKKAEEDAKHAESRAREAESKAKDLELKYGTVPDKEQRIELRRTQTAALDARKETQIRKTIADRKNKALKEPKQLSFVFGLNLENRSRDGVFVYNCSRLIKMYQRIGPQLDGGVLCNGVVGVVDAPYLVLEPTHNKQDFADAKEFRHLQLAMGEHMLQYWRDVDIAQQGVSKFWENFGYISSNWHALPSTDAKYARKRTAQVQITLQCDLCLKWRIIPYSSNNANKVFPDDWVCSMNPDPAHNRCSSSEEKLNLPEGVMKKANKSNEQKEKELEMEIKKKQMMLDKIQHKVIPKKRVDSSSSASSSSSEEDLPALKNNKNLKRSHSKDSNPSPPFKKPHQIRNLPTLSKHTSHNPTTKKHRSKPNDDDEDDEEDDEDDNFKLNRTKPQLNTLTYEKKHKKHHDNGGHGDHSRSNHSSSNHHSSNSSGRKAGRQMGVGQAVKVMVQKKWLGGEVVEEGVDKVKVRLDNSYHGIHDLWLSNDSHDLQAVQRDAEVVNVDSRKPNLELEANGPETPSSSTTIATTTPSPSDVANNQMFEEISNGYRTCLRYFLPPNWPMDKEAVSSLPNQQLASFPLDDFFDQYEKGLRKLVSSFQQEAQVHKSHTESSSTKLSLNRKMIAKLLKTINEDFDIDAECDTEEVDELLSICLHQALDHAKTASPSHQ